MMRRALSLKDKTAVVTGGASGIGHAIALRFAREGARVVIADLQAEPLEVGEATHAMINASGGEAAFVTCDVSVWADVDAAVAKAVERWGRLDIMVNNAATYAGTPLLETPEEAWNRVMAVNATGVFFGYKWAIAHMMDQEPVDEVRGRVINISSQHGMISCPGDVAYGTGKAAVGYMTRQIAADCAE